MSPHPNRSFSDILMILECNYTYNLTPVPEEMYSTSEHLQVHQLQHRLYVYQQVCKMFNTIIITYLQWLWSLKNTHSGMQFTVELSFKSCIIVSQRRVHGQCALHAHQRGEWAFFWCNITNEKDVSIIITTTNCPTWAAQRYGEPWWYHVCAITTLCLQRFLSCTAASMEVQSVSSVLLPSEVYLQPSLQCSPPPPNS